MSPPRARGVFTGLIDPARVCLDRPRSFATGAIILTVHTSRMGAVGESFTVCLGNRRPVEKSALCYFVPNRLSVSSDSGSNCWFHIAVSLRV